MSHCLRRQHRPPLSVAAALKSFNTYYYNKHFSNNINKAANKNAKLYGKREMVTI